ncbi:MAG: SAM-dependent methyltransferase [Rhodopirellula sp.]|nr:SAM-dependent methyltransferase [Rhodopirellula sp.]OUX49838.1 MAG: SAM-dependent methyltransferase [Rhodopirellula sp. TMED283]
MNQISDSSTDSPHENLETLANQASERFQWHWEEIPIAGEIRKLAVASDPEGMLIDACERQDAGEEGVIDPFWATTWRAASGLDHYLSDRALTGMRVLELGCGTGHAGLAAAHRGSQVVLTDGVMDPLILVRMSTWDLRERCQVRQLRFGIDRIEGTAFPLILGSDITYLRSLWPELDQCLREHLAEGGEVLLSDPYRIIGNEFRDWIQNRGWSYREHKIELKDDPAHPIRVMQLTAQ